MEGPPLSLTPERKGGKGKRESTFRHEHGGGGGGGGGAVSDDTEGMEQWEMGGGGGGGRGVDWKKKGRQDRRFQCHIAKGGESNPTAMIAAKRRGGKRKKNDPPSRQAGKGSAIIFQHEERGQNGRNAQERKEGKIHKRGKCNPQFEGI